jgi:hypothetical protein
LTTRRASEGHVVYPPVIKVDWSIAAAISSKEFSFQGKKVKLFCISWRGGRKIFFRFASKSEHPESNAEVPDGRIYPVQIKLTRLSREGG